MTSESNAGSVEFKEGGKFLSLVFLKREYPNEADPCDRDIIVTEIRFSTNSLYGSFLTSIWSSELYSLTEFFKKVVNSVGKPQTKDFELTEHAVTFNVSLSRIQAV